MSLEDFSEALAVMAQRKREEIAEFTQRMGKPDAVIEGMDCWKNEEGVVCYWRRADGMLDPLNQVDYPARLINGLHELLNRK